MRLPLVLLGALLLLGCSDDGAKTANASLDKLDPALGLTRDDYKTLHETPETPPEGPPIPHLAMQLDRETAPRISNDKVLSLSVTSKVPVKDVLMELAARADVDIEIDPRIEGGVDFTARRQLFSKILSRLCRMAGLRYTVDDDVVRVEVDDPYLKTYSLDYLSLSRKAESEMGIATNVFAPVVSTTRTGNTTTTSQDAQNGNNSVTKVNTSAMADLWPEVEANIESILANTRGGRNWRTADSSVTAQLRQEGLSAAKPFAANRQAGLITVYATRRQHEALSTYLERLKRNLNSQVLIEARIVEVDLNEDFRSGINWRTLMGGALNAAARFGPSAAAAPFISSSTATDGVVTLSLNSGDFASVLNFVRGFGATRTLSSPRLTVLNNQPAVLKVARNEVYFTSTIETT
ncbi:MAG TPA: secretin N-terminal domain-containing protein, partial [Alphaproteobacteria bacterium]|nr:secretin N-terminal domain-containing protein [Alphaproteobacteria bacterium]